ncbi:MAG: LysM peptidoglycan-binding domain-containing protein, partial [Actinomycetes bacterium]
VHGQGPASRRRTLVRVGRAVGVPLLLAGLVTAGSPGWGSYTIRNGDTLSEIADRYNTTVAKLVQVNRLTGNGHLIFAGKSLKVPTAGPTTQVRTVNKRHRVVPGDSLIKIARRYGVAATTVARANKLPSSNIVRLGDTLVIPVRQRVSSSGGNTFAGRTYGSSTVAAADRNRAILASRNLPSRNRVRDVIAATARANGVDPALALAISWQEAGWDQGRVSVANAIGAMQVLPGTGEWISDVIGRDLDLLKTSDNATAGVVLLKILTRSAGEKKAIAGYYQGLRSVRERGMFPDTKRYVANVLALKRQFG